MTAILAKMLGLKGAWKFVFDVLVYMVKQQATQLKGSDKLQLVILALKQKYPKLFKVWEVLEPDLVAAASALKKLYKTVSELLEEAKPADSDKPLEISK